MSAAGYVLVVFLVLDGVTPPEITRTATREECDTLAAARIAEHEQAGRSVAWAACQPFSLAFRRLGR